MTARGRSRETGRFLAHAERGYCTAFAEDRGSSRYLYKHHWLEDQFGTGLCNDVQGSATIQCPDASWLALSYVALPRSSSTYEVDFEGDGQVQLQIHRIPWFQQYYISPIDCPDSIVNLNPTSLLIADVPRWHQVFEWPTRGRWRPSIDQTNGRLSRACPVPNCLSLTRLVKSQSRYCHASGRRHGKTRLRSKRSVTEVCFSKESVRGGKGKSFDI